MLTINTKSPNLKFLMAVSETSERLALAKGEGRYKGTSSPDGLGKKGWGVSTPDLHVGKEVRKERKGENF